MTWLRWIPKVCMVLAIACGDDDDGSGGETQGEGSTTAPTTSATTTTSATSEGSSTDATTASTSASTTAAESSSDAGSSEASSAGSESGGAACGTGDPCGGDQICVLPCCGGPAPPCIDMPRGGCDPEDSEVPADQCNQPCATPMCCLDNCVADPPYCANESDLSCNGGTNCSIDSCFGTVTDGQLYCECA